MTARPEPISLGRQNGLQPPPVSFGQQRMWLLQQTLPDPATYNVPIVYHLHGVIEADRLRKSLQVIVNRHEVLRTALVQDGEALIQRILPATEVILPWVEVDLRAVPVDEQEALVEKRLAEEVRRPFDLNQAPLWRACWLNLAANEHVLLLNFHHSLIDVWSLRLLFKEWSQLYAAGPQFESAQLPELPVQYADYAVWQRHQVAGELLEPERAFWCQQLKALPPPLELPTLGVRPLQRSGKGAVYRFSLSNSLTTELRGLAQDERATVFRLMLTAFQIWLHRYTGQNDILVGIPVANRKRAEVQSLVGFFLNTLPIRTRVEGDLSFREFLGRVQVNVKEALAHAELPFEQIVEIAAQGREGSQTPLFQVMFVLTKNLAPKWSLDSVEARAVPSHTGTSKSDLILAIHTENAAWECEFEYASDLFTAPSVARMAVHFEELLRSIVAHPDETIGRLNLLSAEERHRLLVTWNDTRTDIPTHECVHQLFERQVDRTPDAVAVTFEDQSLTYQELNRRANQLAHRLRMLGVTDETPVALYLERSLEMMVGLIAILKAGGAYVPIDPGYPADRVAFILDDVRAPILLTQQAVKEQVPAGQARVLCIDDPAIDLEDQPTSNPSPVGGVESTIYIIYTSGSTGRPKGCSLTHHNVSRLLHATKPWFEFNEKDVWTLFHSCAFDFSVWEIWGALVYGGKLVIVPYLVSRSPELFCALLARQRVTVLNQTPSAFKQLMAVELASGSPRNLALRTVIFGGETLDIRSLKPWFDAHGDECPRLVNMYGITETTVHVTYRPLTKSDVQGGSVIGIPIPDLRLYVLDPEMNPCPIGIPGEMYVGGAGVAREYLHRPELTAERFLDSPFVAGDRLYRTGDLARWSPDRDLEYLGRKDQQVKVRGFRIELGEIEAVLGANPELNACAIIAQRDGTDSQSLCAFVVARDPARLSLEDLREWLGRKLPDYMVPARFSVLESLPLTSNGKLDRQALATLEGVALNSRNEYVAPRTNLEGQLACLWQEVLPHNRVGVRDDFFALGGHSLLAIALGTRLSSLLRQPVPLRWIFEHPTVEGLARRIETDGRSSVPWAAMPPTDRRQPLPVSFGQQRMWLLQQTLPDPATYNVPVVYRLQGLVERERLRNSLQVIVNRHEVLRTALVQDGEALIQKILPAIEVILPWVEVDLRAVPVAELEAVVEKRLAEEVRRPFDLCQAPLWRAMWLNLAADNHVLLINFHHSVIDEWSLRLLFKEWSQLYAAGPQFESAQLPELPVQYADYAAWQRQQVSGELLEPERTYWREQLKALPPPLELPTRSLRPVARSGNGAVHRFSLSNSLTTGLLGLAQDEGATPFRLMLATFQVWLHRYTGQTDILVGIPVTNRKRGEVQSLVGFFLNTLPIRTRLEGSPSFRELLRRVQENLKEALVHAELPFEQIVEITGQGREGSQTPLFQVMFVLTKNLAPTWSLDSVEVRAVPSHTGTSKSDLVLAIHTENAAWECEFEYASDLFTAPSVARMAVHFEELLRSIVAHPDETIGRLNLLPEEERHRLLVTWNDTRTDIPTHECVHQLFERQVDRTPDAVAVTFEDQSLTYQELNRRANQLAHHLLGLGVERDIPVGLCLDRSLEMVVAVLGILKAGGAYVPLDPNYPKDRLSYMVENVASAILVTQEKESRNLPKSEGTVVYLDRHSRDIALQRSENPSYTASPNQLAYVIYTSGSTGQPKGVMIPHGALVNHMNWMQRQFGFTSEDRTLQKTPISFDASVWEFYAPLLSGGCLILAPAEAHRDPERLIRTVIEQNVTVVQFVPTLLDFVLKDPRWTECRSLRHVFCGGEALSPHLVAMFFELSGARLHNLYGPTEVTIDATFHTCSPGEIRESVPIGRPIDNTEAYVLDDHQQPVPVGVTGELYLGGKGLARGYWGKAEMTAEKFIRHPFHSSLETRVYRTGDLARWSLDQNLEYLGRRDHQVKVRGFRIELGEVETALGAHPELSACAVVALRGESGGSCLIAFVVARDPARLSVEDLREWLERKLPDYMVPARFSVLESLPLTPNGKLDRQALEKLEGVALSSTTEYVAPRTELEGQLAKLWQEALLQDRVGVRDDFFAMGGHSLMAIALGSRLSSLLRRKVPLRWLFEHPTVEALARRIEADVRFGPAWAAIPPADRRQALPMSFGQQRMWLLQQTLPDPATYNVPVVYHLQGAVAVERLRESLQIIVARHEVLRTALVQEGEALIQKILPPAEVILPWVVVDLQAVPEDQKKAFVERLLAEEVRRPFDLSQAPLWRGCWLCLGAEEYLLALTFHHGVMDEWSMRLFFKEWEHLYAACPSAELAALPVQYADYAVWQRQQLSDELLEQERTYWREELIALPLQLELPTEKARPARPSGQGEVHRFVLPGPLVEALRGLARQEATSLFSLMLGAFQVWLHRYSGQDDLIVGTPVANRDRPEVQSLLGFFLNTLPLRSRLESGQSFRGLLGRVQERVHGALAHADLPFEQIVELTTPSRAMSQTPLYHVMFVLVEEGLPEWRLDQARLELLPIRTKTSKGDLLLSLNTASPQWECEFEYASDLFTSPAVARMAVHFEELLRSIVAHPDETIGRLNLLPAEERHRLLVTSNDTRTDIPTHECVHQLFEAQVERTPDAVAVTFEDQSLTYQELNRRANQLAYHLHRLGVGPEVPVGLCLERSLEMVIAVLGILKAGGAYVPLDPNYPKDRLAYMIEDNGGSWLVTQTALKSRLPTGMANAICLEDLPDGLGEENLAVCASAKNLAYILYTSGSTGQPKGVAMEHGPLVNLVEWQVRQSEAGLRTLQFASLNFDVSFQEMFSTWSSGGMLVLIDPQTRLDPPALWEFIAGRKLERLFLPVVMLRHLVEAAAPSQQRVPSLREVITAGEQLRITPAIRGFFSSRPEVTLHNHYGPTESHVVTAWTLPRSPDTWPELPPIGKPIFNTRIYLLDKYGNPVPMGMPGELYIGGNALARGYWKQPERTAERFVRDPFDPAPQARLYRTGDLARTQPDGCIEYLGRADHQVKIRGFRVELGEIDTVLGTHPDLSACAVVALNDGDGGKSLAAFLVARKGASVSVETLRSWAGQRLPDYMVPTRFTLLESLPLTPNGKVDRQALLTREGGELTAGTSYVPARNLLESKLVQIWQALLRSDRVGIDDNFFELGGHSLQAVRMAAQIEKLLGRKLPIAALFQTPTIESLARRLTDDHWAPRWSSLVPLQPLGSNPPLFLVHGWGGDVYTFLDLAQLLAPDQPVFGIQAVGLDGKAARHTTLEGMAAHYVQELRSLQPEGPYMLGGYSMGGLIAFEVAQQLHRLGQRVSLLALFDTGPISIIPWPVYVRIMASYLCDRAVFHLRQFWKMPNCDRAEYFRGRWIALQLWMAKNRSKPPVVPIPPSADSPAPQVPGFADYYLALASVYRLQRYPGSVDVFLSDDSNPIFMSCWGHLARDGVTFHPVTGQHLQILTPAYIQAVAAILSTVIKRAR